jgi:hypothetical protein
MGSGRISDGLKSLGIALTIVFVYLFLLGGDLKSARSNGIFRTGRRHFSFCEGWLADAPVLEYLPCSVLNIVVAFSTMLTIVAAYMLVRTAGRALRGG